ncbi:hypothetical protein ACIRLA_21825 [Streptomyces sp. NPDC102364]|uniref:hypothetical protein n=1 Tax=Streptomyces sp. NPDC102364 TaxID=3366161 RepID=UPI0037F4E2F9
MILNLTPHPIRIYVDDRPDGIDELDWGIQHVIDPEPTPVQSGWKATPARLAVESLRGERREGIPVALVQHGQVDGLPDQQDGISYIVSLPVALALVPRRSDLLVPYREVRNSSGTVIGCRQLAQPV